MYLHEILSWHLGFIHEVEIEIDGTWIESRASNYIGFNYVCIYNNIVIDFISKENTSHPDACSYLCSLYTDEEPKRAVQGIHAETFLSSIVKNIA